jgi:hypothetical protein
MIASRIVATLAIAAMLFAMPAWSKSVVIPRPGDIMGSIVVPEGPLHLKNFDKEGSAHFDGQIQLSGTYYYGDNQYSEAPGAQATLYLNLDKASKARLPYFKDYDVPASIYLLNDAAFVKAVLSKEQLKASRKKNAKYATGKVQIVVDRLETGIECDVPFINVRFVSVVHQPLRLAAADLPDEGC